MTVPGFLFSVLLNSNGGKFASAGNFATGNDPTAALIGDFNGDGNLDVATVNSGDQTASVFVGNGDGTFAGTQSISTGGNAPNALAAGDFGNGTLDLATVVPSSNQVTLLVNTVGTTTNLISDNSAPEYGQNVTFTATIAPGAFGSSTPTGSVDFYYDDGSNAGYLGAASLDGNGSATLVISSLGVGSTSISAGYAGDGNYNSSSASITQPIYAAGTSTALSSDVNPASNGQTVTFTAAVTGNFAGSGTPSGTVYFYDYSNSYGWNYFGAANLDGNAQASLGISSLPSGDNSISAYYGGDGNFNANWSSSLNQTVFQGTTTNLGDDVNPSAAGQSVTLSASVYLSQYGYSYGAITGAVNFYDDNGSTYLGSGNVDYYGNATLVTSGLSVGSHSLIAIYSGDGNNNGSSSSTLYQTVYSTSNPTTTTLGDDSNPSTYGQPVTLTAAVSSNSTSTGNVDFYDNYGSTYLGSAALDGNGNATFVISSLGVGSHAITANYNGDGNNNGSSASALYQTVYAADTSTSLSADVYPSSANQTVTFTASLAPTWPGSGTPSGTVYFYDYSNSYGWNYIGAASLDGNGQATLGTSSLAAGAHSISAYYSGDGNYNANWSSSLNQTVLQGTTTNLGDDVNPSAAGQSVTLSASVYLSQYGYSYGAITGAVNFYDDNGSTYLGSGNVDYYGNATLVTSGLSVGSHSLIAIYSGDGNNNGSSSSTLYQTVYSTSNPTTTTLGDDSNPSAYGQPVTLTATVSSNGIPTGNVDFYDNSGSTYLGSAALDGNGNATFVISSLGVGSHTLTANYNGDGNYYGSSSSLDQTVNTADTATALSADVNPASNGQTVTFTAAVTANIAGSGTPSGAVYFYDGGNYLGSGTIDGNGQTTFATSALAAGTHDITASYSGDGNYNGSTSPDLSQTILQDTGTAINADANPSAYGQPVTFTGTVSASAYGAFTPTGTLQFYSNGNYLGSGTLDGNAQATFTTSGLPVGADSITANYSGDGNYAASGSPAIAQTVNPADTATSISADLSPAVFGQPITFTAAVAVNAPGSGTATGIVTFFDGATSLGNAALDGNGQAVFTTSALPAGDHAITAWYSGDPNFNASTSASLSQTVNPDATLTSISASANPLVVGQLVTLSAAVSAVAPGAGTPSGTVTFMDGTATLGTGILDGSGRTSLLIPGLPVGGQSITAVYAGDNSFSSSSSPALSESVGPDRTTTTLSPSVNPSVFGQSITFAAIVSADAPGSGTPSGTVRFRDGATILGTGTLSGGIATFTTAALSVAPHIIAASYAGDTNFTASASAAFTQTVSQSSTSTAIASNANPSAFGQPVTFTATVAVSGPGAGMPSGTVDFLDGTTTIGAATLDAAGAATFSTASFPVAGHSITAVYSGDGNFAASASAALIQNVGPAATTTSLASSGDPSVHGAPVNFTAIVASVAPGAGTPGGTVQFEIDGANLGSPVPLDAGGSATSALASALAVGDHTIIAVYAGGIDFTRSTAPPITQSVTKDATATTLASSTNPSSFGQGMTFTATVTAAAPGSGTPGGSVTFMDGAVTLGTATLSGGVATVTTAAPAPSSHSITAIYGGDSDFTPSTSLSLTQTTNQASTTVAVTLSSNPAVFGQSITLVAGVSASAPGSGTPTGTVTFRDGATTLGTGTLDGSGQATLATSALSVGGHSITVVYGGDTNFAVSTSGTLNQVVNQSSSSASISSDRNPSVVGQSVTFTAVVTATAPGASTPTGTVTFMDGTTSLGSVSLIEGTTTLTTASLAVGSHFITAVYSGDTTFFASNSAVLTQIEGNPIRIGGGAIVPIVVRSTLPSSVVSGAKFHGSVTVDLTNPSQSLVKGGVTIKLFVSNDGTIESASKLLAKLSHAVRIKARKTAVVVIPIRSMSATLSYGAYTLLAQVTDAFGNTSSSTSGPVLKVAPPLVMSAPPPPKAFISLRVLGISVTPGTIKLGKRATFSVTVANDGNHPTRGSATFNIGLSVDGTTATSTPIRLKHKLKIKPGGQVTLHLRARAPAWHPAGTFFPVVTVIQHGVTASAVGLRQLTITG